MVEDAKPKRKPGEDVSGGNRVMRDITDSAALVPLVGKSAKMCKYAVK